MILQFDVINQRVVRRDDNYIVANSQCYLQIDFNFTQDWQGFGKTITFVNGANKYSIGLNTQDSCVVPYEVIKTPSFTFSIKGILNDVVITTGVVTVPIKPSGETQGVTPSDPPKQIYDGLQNGLKGQVLGKVSDDNYDYDFQNLKDLQYDNENTLGEILEELVVDAVTDIKYEDGYLKKVENGETTNVVEMYDKQGIDDLLENLDQYIEKSNTPGLIKNDGTIDTTQYATQSDLDSAKSNLQANINDLDRELIQSISNEENARINADSVLQGLINDEKGARQNVDTQLQNAIDTKTQEITIINQQITNWFINENQEFSNYAYVSNTTISDLINAKYVNVSFSLSDLEANNICPIQIVDNTLGILTIYSNDNSSITIPYIYIFK